MEQSHDRVEIPLSKKKFTLMLIGALVFVALGIWFVITPATFSEGTLRTPIVVRIIGIAGVVISGLFTFYAVGKLIDNKPGITIDDTGITDNASAVAAGHILWADVYHMSVVTVRKQSFVVLYVQNPQQYVHRQKSAIKRKLLELNVKVHGSPITITAKGLTITLDELYRLLTERKMAIDVRTVESKAQ